MILEERGVDDNVLGTGLWGCLTSISQYRSRCLSGQDGRHLPRGAPVASLPRFAFEEQVLFSQACSASRIHVKQASTAVLKSGGASNIRLSVEPLTSWFRTQAAQQIRLETNSS